MKKEAQISWSPKLVDINKIKPTPVNYKIRNALGAERLKESLKEFGIAGTVVVNTDFTLIDGNSRLAEEKEKGKKQLWVSMPDRKLSPVEFSRMTKVFDSAKAGDVDYERIQGDKGTTKDFLEKYNLPIPKSRLDKLGAKQLNDYKQERKELKEKTLEEKNLSSVVLVQLFFNEKDHAAFRKEEQRLQKKYKTKDTTRTVLKALQIAK